MQWPALIPRGSFCLLLILIELSVTDVKAQVFVPTGHMTRGRIGHSATLLQDGHVLIAGGSNPVTYLDPSSSAEIYDPDSGTFVETGAMSSPRSFHSAVLLLDGRVLLVGGCTGTCSTSAELYNPATGTFSRTGDVSIAQQVNAAVLLRNGKVLVVGDLTAQLFDPASRTFASVGSSQFIYSATLLVDGTVLLNGGSAASIYDPVSNQFRNVPLYLKLAGSPAAPLLDGSVAFPGGYYGYFVSLRQNAFYDPSTQTFQLAANMTLPRAYHTATLLKDGRLLIAGGSNGEGSDEITGIFGSAEIYDPARLKFSLLAKSMVLHREGHQATLLPDGRVLISGGATALSNSQPPFEDTRAELFVPESYPGAVPQLSLDRARYCVGDPWILRADALAPLSAVQISGTWDGTPWTIANWRTSRENGTVEASGTFGADTVGDYWVWLHAGGNISNTVAIRIEDCIDDFQR